MSHKLEQVQFKLLGFRDMQENLENYFLMHAGITESRFFVIFIPFLHTFRNSVLCVLRISFLDFLIAIYEIILAPIFLQL